MDKRLLFFLLVMATGSPAFAQAAGQSVAIQHGVVTAGRQANLSTGAEPEGAMVGGALAESQPAAAESQPAAGGELAGTHWELLEIQSMDDTAWKPNDPSRYTLTLEADGNAYMQLDCNRGRGGWSSTGSGQIAFKPVASTNALCQDDGLGERFAAQFEFVRSYVFRDGHLFLATLADGAIIELQPAVQ